jgi:hypothetical protein
MSSTVHDLAYDVRQNLSAAIDAIWEHIAAPGSWWTGPERVAIAQASREAWECPYCQSCKDALSPYSVSGSHTTTTPLTEAAIDAIHRITTDPGRLTESWYQSVFDRGLSSEKYVEITSIIGHLTAADTFHRGLGLDLRPLPEPLDGVPSQGRSDNARVQMAWVPTVSHKDATGALAEEWYPGGKKGFVPHVAQSLTLVPDEAISFKRKVMTQFYLNTGIINDVNAPVGSLERPQAEFLAARTSALNECFY